MLLRDMFDEFARSVEQEAESELVFRRKDGDPVRMGMHVREHPAQPAARTWKAVHPMPHTITHVVPMVYRYHDVWRSFGQPHHGS